MSSSEYAEVDDDERVEYVEPQYNKEVELRRQLIGASGEIARETLAISKKLLGEGVMGKVNEGTFNGEKVAVKTLKPEADADVIAHFLQEICIMKQFKHLNIARVVGFAAEGDPILLVLEKCDEALDAHLRRYKKKITIPTRLRFSIDISRGVSYLANSNFVHRDLSSRNVLLQKQTCKLTDFGMGCPLARSDAYYKSKGGRIPLRWSALEVINYGKFTTATDVWSLGVVMYEIFSNAMIPFKDSKNVDIPDLLQSGYRLPPDGDCPKAVYSLMLRCWAEDPSQRPPAINVCRDLVGITRRGNFALATADDQPKQITLSPQTLSQEETYQYAPPPPPRSRLPTGASAPGPPVPGRPSLQPARRSSMPDEEEGVAYMAPVTDANRVAYLSPSGGDDRSPDDPAYRAADAVEALHPDYSAPAPKALRGKPASPLGASPSPDAAAGGGGPHARSAPSINTRMRLALDAQNHHGGGGSAEGSGRSSPTTVEPSKVNMRPGAKPSMNTRMRLSLAAQGQMDVPVPPPRRNTPLSSPRGTPPSSPPPEFAAHPIETWFIQKNVSREVCEKWLKDPSYRPGTFIVREKSPGKYALTIVYRTSSIKHLMITLTNQIWELGDVLVKDCSSLTDLISRLYSKAPELDWSTPLTGPPSKETLDAIIRESS